MTGLLEIWRWRHCLVVPIILLGGAIAFDAKAAADEPSVVLEKSRQYAGYLFGEKVFLLCQIVIRLDLPTTCQGAWAQ